jgi:type I restriction enzyme S subunit
MAKYQAYSDYKETSVLGIESIPTDWDIQRIKFLFNIGRGRVISEQELEDDGQFPVYSSQTKNNGCLGYIGTYDFDCEQITWTTDGANAGTVFLRNGKHNCTNVCGTLQPKYSDLCMGFTLYCLEYVTQFHKRPDTNGAKIMNNEMADISISQPPACDREKIAEFLDHETAQIDTLIDKQQQLIKLLKEKRQAVISHAVTKGLNPDAAMKDSGVEWLGEVPEHWVSCALKYYARVVDCKHITAEFFDEGIPLASISEVKEWYVNLETAKFTNERYYLDLIGGGRKPEVGDIIYSRNATVGEAALVPENMPNFAMGQDVCLIRLDPGVLPEYLLYVLNSGVISNQLDLAMVGSTFKRINVDDIRNFAVALPSYEEQIEIVGELTRILGKYDMLIINAEKAISLMTERRTALISAAVTGKIDVRSWQAPESSTQEVING